MLSFGFVNIVDAQSNGELQTKLITHKPDQRPFAGSELHFSKGGFIAPTIGDASILFGNKKGLKLTLIPPIGEDAITRVNLVSINVHEVVRPGRPKGVVKEMALHAQQSNVGNLTPPPDITFNTDHNNDTLEAINVPYGNPIRAPGGGTVAKQRTPFMKDPRFHLHAIHRFVGELDSGASYLVMDFSNDVFQFHARTSVLETFTDGMEHEVGRAGPLNIQDSKAPLVISPVKPEEVNFVKGDNIFLTTKKVERDNKEQGFVGIGVVPGAALHVEGDLILMGDPPTVISMGVGSEGTVNGTSSPISWKSDYKTLLTINDIKILGVTHNFNASVLTNIKARCNRKSSLMLQLTRTHEIGTFGDLNPISHEVIKGPESNIQTEGCCNQVYPIGASLSVAELRTGGYTLIAQAKTEGCTGEKEAKSMLSMTYNALPVAALKGIPAAKDAATQSLGTDVIGEPVTIKGEPSSSKTQLNFGNAKGIMARGNTVLFFDNSVFAKLKVDRIFADVFREIKQNIFYGSSNRRCDELSGYLQSTIPYEHEDCQDNPMAHFIIRTRTGAAKHIGVNIYNSAKPEFQGITVNMVFVNSDRNTHRQSKNFYPCEGSGDNQATCMDSGRTAEFTGNPIDFSGGVMKIGPNGIRINGASDIIRSGPNQTNNLPKLKINGDLVFAGAWRGPGINWVLESSFDTGVTNNKSTFTASSLAGSRTFVVPRNNMIVAGRYQLKVFAVVQAIARVATQEKLSIDVLYDGNPEFSSGKVNYQYETTPSSRPGGSTDNSAEQNNEPFRDFNNEGLTISLMAVGFINFKDIDDAAGRTFEIQLNSDRTNVYLAPDAYLNMRTQPFDYRWEDPTGGKHAYKDNRNGGIDPMEGDKLKMFRVKFIVVGKKA